MATNNNNNVTESCQNNMVVFKTDLSINTKVIVWEQEVRVKEEEEEITIKDEPIEAEVDDDDFALSDDEDELEVEPEKEEEGKSSKEPCKCEFCGKVFLYPSALKRHIVTHTEEKNYVCHLCQRGFGSNNHLLRHYRTVHKVEPPPKPKTVHKCEFCPETFEASGRLKRHTVHKHTKEKRHKCEQCGLRFYSNSHLVRHSRAHAQEKAFECAECGRRFLEKFNLQAHERIHRGELPYGCSFCEKRFRASNTLRQHEMTHTGERRHACEVCGMKFIAKSTLSRHLLTHDAQRKKPFKCALCADKAFGTRSHVRRHFKAVHKGVEARWEVVK